eukprot:g2921.t1
MDGKQTAMQGVKFEAGVGAGVELEEHDDLLVWIHNERYATQNGKRSRYRQRSIREVSVGALARLLTEDRADDLGEPFCRRKRAVVDQLRRGAPLGSAPPTMRLEALHCCVRDTKGEVAVYACALSTVSTNGSKTELIFGVEDNALRSRWMEELGALAAAAPGAGDSSAAQSTSDEQEPSAEQQELFKLCRADDPDIEHIEKVLERVKAQPGSVNVRFSEMRRTALHRAALRGSERLVEMLVRDCGASVNMRDSSNKTALHEAVLSGVPAVVEMLLKHGADIDARKHKGSTALHRAISNNHPKIAAMLVEHGARAHLSKRKQQGEMRVYRETAFKAAIRFMPQVAGLVLDRQYRARAGSARSRWAQVESIWREQHAAVVLTITGRHTGPCPWQPRAFELMCDAAQRALVELRWAPPQQQPQEQPRRVAGARKLAGGDFVAGQGR